MQNTISFELISWVITALVVCLVLAPIYFSIGEDYPFYVENILFVIIFISFLRVIFLLPFHWFDPYIPMKLVMIFIVIPVLLYLIDNAMDFQAYADEKGLQTFMQKLTADRQLSLVRYIKSEYLFFFAGALICSLALPIKMIRSIWRMKNPRR